MQFRYCHAILDSNVKSISGNERKRNEELGLRKISYKKLWKLLIDLEMNKKTLAQRANISQSTLTKMLGEENVNIDIIVRICNALDCEFHDVVEMVTDENGNA